MTAAPHGRMITLGTAGEHIACADLIMRGHCASMTAAGMPYDLVAEVNGRLLRVAVKSTLAARPRSGRTLTRPCYQFGIGRRGGRYGPDDADIIALVALDRRLVCYLPVAGHPSLIHLDEPGPILYLNVKGPKRGMCKRFEDFTLADAIGETA